MTSEAKAVFDQRDYVFESRSIGGNNSKRSANWTGADGSCGRLNAGMRWGWR